VQSSGRGRRRGAGSQAFEKKLKKLSERIGLDDGRPKATNAEKQSAVD
jgi:hypothetical protein